MSKEDRNNLNAYHNRGEQDAAEDKGYNEPKRFLGGVFNQEYEDEQNAAYRQGYDNAKSQKK